MLLRLMLHRSTPARVVLMLFACLVAGGLAPAARGQEAADPASAAASAEEPLAAPARQSLADAIDAQFGTVVSSMATVLFWEPVPARPSR